MKSFSNPAEATNDMMVTTWSDSFARGTFGQRQNFYIGEYYLCYFPQYFIAYRDHSRSGGNNGDMMDTRLPALGIPDAITSHGITNGLNIYWVSDNGGFTSNTIYGWFLNILQYPTNTFQTNGAAPVHDWTQTTPQFRFDAFVIGDVVYNSLNSNTRDLSYGARNAATNAGLLFVDTWSNMYPVTAANTATPANLWFPNGAAFDHPNNSYDFIWAMKTLTGGTNNYRGIGVDTNAFTVIIDGNALTVTSTNHCVIANLSGVSTNFSLTFHADRMAPSGYFPNGIQTNDIRPSLTLAPEVGNAFHEDWVITGLPTGVYEWTWDDRYTNTVTSAQLASGYNNFTNFNNPLRAQNNAVLSNMCLVVQFSPTNASDQINIGNNQLNVNYESIANTVWPTNAPGVDAYGQKLETTFGVETAAFGMDRTNHTIVQQVLHTNRFKLLYTGSGYTPAPFR